MLLSSVLLLARVNLVHEPQTNHFNKRTFVVCEGKEGVQKCKKEEAVPVSWLNGVSLVCNS